MALIINFTLVLARYTRQFPHQQPHLHTDIVCCSCRDVAPCPLYSTINARVTLKQHAMQCIRNDYGRAKSRVSAVLSREALQTFVHNKILILISFKSLALLLSFRSFDSLKNNSKLTDIYWYDYCYCYDYCYYHLSFALTPPTLFFLCISHPVSWISAEKTSYRIFNRCWSVWLVIVFHVDQFQFPLPTHYTPFSIWM